MRYNKDTQLWPRRTRTQLLISSVPLDYKVIEEVFLTYVSFGYGTIWANPNGISIMRWQLKVRLREDLKVRVKVMNSSPSWQTMSIRTNYQVYKQPQSFTVSQGGRDACTHRITISELKYYQDFFFPLIKGALHLKILMSISTQWELRIFSLHLRKEGKKHHRGERGTKVSTLMYRFFKQLCFETCSSNNSSEKDYVEFFQ